MVRCTGLNVGILPMTENLPRSFRTLALVSANDPRVEPTWRALEAAARPPYFLTWGWIATWLASLPADARPQLAMIIEGGAVVAACFLGRRRRFRHGVLPVRGLFLNT